MFTQNVSLIQQAYIHMCVAAIATLPMLFSCSIAFIPSSVFLPILCFNHFLKSLCNQNNYDDNNKC